MNHTHTARLVRSIVILAAMALLLACFACQWDRVQIEAGDVNVQPAPSQEVVTPPSAGESTATQETHDG